ncbi:MAG: GTP 3',8-cyclase MoaA [Verrucomicrobiales bacterium]|nr:GTP 3',8-cyclase MoaA [Verrucomicrobiales bacterium]
MAITDQFQRPLHDLRISVTDRCNFRCRYCMPAEIFGPDYQYLPRKDILDYEEIARLAKVFISLGVRKLRLTGGEPLLRKNLVELISQLAAIDQLEDLALTTNGTALAQQAKALKDAGLQRVTVSLDALDPDIFTAMNGINARPDKTLRGIIAAKEAGLLVKVNTVVQRGINESEVLPLVKFAQQHGLILRFIEYMDTGAAHGWKLDKVVPSSELLTHLKEHFELKPLAPNHPGETAVRHRLAGSDAELGFISSVTQPFCTNCSRARLTADGHLFTCLFAPNGHDLKEVLRGGASDEELAQTLRAIWDLRSDRYSEIRSQATEASHPRPEMSYLGG